MALKAQAEHCVELDKGVPSSKLFTCIRFSNEFKGNRHRLRSVEVVIDCPMKLLAQLTGPLGLAPVVGMNRHVVSKLLQIIEVALSGAQAFIARHKLGAVFRAEAEQAKRQRTNSRRPQVV